MDVGTINFLVQLQRSILRFYNSDFMFGLKILLAVYISVIIADIILIIIAHTPGMYLRVLKTGSNVPIIHKNKMQKRWEKVRARLQSENISQYKLAVLEADKIADEILFRVGYLGNNMGERLGQISSDQLEIIEELKKAHEVRNKIIHQSDFVLDKKKAKEVVEIYQKMLETLEFI